MGKNRLKIRNNIKELRAANGDMTQAQLAGKLGVTRQTVLTTESGRNYPSIELAFRMGIIFKKPVTEIFYVDRDDLEDFEEEM